MVTNKIDYGELMDPECVPLCDAMNKIKGITTDQSCCGHGRKPFRIYFYVKTLKALKEFSTHLIGNWRIIVRSDPFTYMWVESNNTGEEAYKESKLIAKRIEKNYVNGKCIKK